MKQIAFTRGLLEFSHINLYREDEPKDSDGKMIDEKYALKTSIPKCTDLVNKKTFFQTRAEKIRKKFSINVIIDFSPKYHPKDTDTGIKYTWARSTFYLRSIPVNNRKNKQVFMNYVHLSISNTDGAKLTKE